MFKLAIAASLLFGACKWTEFDDLETDAWVHSTTKPNSDAADYGVAMIAGGVGTDPAGDRLVVLGAGQALYSELNYTPDGNVTFVGTDEIKLNNEFAISTLDDQPILIKDPTSDEVSLVVNSGGGSVAVLSGTHMLMQRQIFSPENANPDAAAYVIAPTTPVGSLVVVATLESVYGSPNVPGAVASACRLHAADGTTTVPVVALAGARTVASHTTDDLVVWSSTGKLYLYPSGVSTADPAVCLPVTPPVNPPPPGIAVPIAGSTAVDTGFVPAKGSQLFVLDGRYAILVGHMADTSSTSQIMMYDLQANGGLMPALVGTPITHPGQRSAAVLTVDATHRYLAAGYPNDDIDGVATGQVTLYTIDTTTGLATNPAEVLSDDQPDGNELFGRALATYTFNGKQILAVGASNEIFAYYRTLLYDDARAQ